MDIDTGQTNFVSIIAILSTIALPIALGMYMAIRSSTERHKENLELIKQGVVPPKANKKGTPNRLRTLRNGMLCVGLAVGLAVSYLITGDGDIGSNLVIEGGSILFFLGLAYVLFFILTKDMVAPEDEVE